MGTATHDITEVADGQYDQDTDIPDAGDNTGEESGQDMATYDVDMDADEVMDKQQENPKKVEKPVVEEIISHHISYNNDSIRYQVKFRNKDINIADWFTADELPLQAKKLISKYNYENGITAPRRSSRLN
ncbi:hypothetical protein H4R20_001358 [Coemansia guatemalensis]|uniref:Uncharacterized protein n=1 Tax=Coemansia guatemalensis TaxID=2761395 RepID=A0A9W8HX58_9FUNG|nr:hypothetical protein H4R20_001358 [Coemansia guatemalensis]